LRYEETRNKKLLWDNPLADWELRIHPVHLFYYIDQVGQRVRILAFGVKKREKREETIPLEEVEKKLW
jgi:hypothetical protein